MRAASLVPATYVGPDGARRFLVRAGPRFPEELVGVEVVLPTQWAARGPCPPSGPRHVSHVSPRMSVRASP
jgi:hypothetical protein